MKNEGIIYIIIGIDIIAWCSFPCEKYNNRNLASLCSSLTIHKIEALNDEITVMPFSFKPPFLTLYNIFIIYYKDKIYCYFCHFILLFHVHIKVFLLFYIHFSCFFFFYVICYTFVLLVFVHLFIFLFHVSVESSLYFLGVVVLDTYFNSKVC